MLLRTHQQTTQVVFYSSPREHHGGEARGLRYADHPLLLRRALLQSSEALLHRNEEGVHPKVFHRDAAAVGSAVGTPT